MKRIKNYIGAAILSSAVIFVLSGCPATEVKDPVPTGPALDLTGYELKSELSDDFEGTELDRSKWNVFVGSKEQGNVYNNEEQHYVDDGSTVIVKNGKLTLKAYKKNNIWYSGKIQSDSNGSAAGMPFKYGYVEAKIKLPASGSSTPAIIFSSVDLPVPFIPIIPILSPSCKKNDTSLKSSRPVKDFFKCSIVNIFIDKLIFCSFFQST